jgi:sulfatase modifying factor 1
MKHILILTMLIVALSFTSRAYSQSYPEMITVDGGTFCFGNIESEGENDEQPTHEVTLKTFKIAKTETTVAQYRAYCNAAGVKMPEPLGWDWTDNQPIVNVSWNDAVAYCDWLSDKTGNIYCLPTEAEWEYAARGGKLSKGYKYSGGQSMPSVGWFNENSNSQTQEVAQKHPNELGLYDMSGNVVEWCKDWYGAYTPNPQTNPNGPSTGSFRMLRGGTWDDPAAYCRVAYRYYHSPGYRIYYIGFRVVSPE